jgi:hypothetical protein
VSTIDGGHLGHQKPSRQCGFTKRLLMKQNISC